jgi:hypothetical protein
MMPPSTSDCVVHPRRRHVVGSYATRCPTTARRWF